jgi:hypothetical protein
MGLHNNKVYLLYQRIGEFTVSFQWLEHRFREIGWLLIDPHRYEWPPTQLRNLTNHDLLNRVKSLYVETVGSFPGKGAKIYCDSFQFVIDEAHRARRARNTLLHSAFVELKAGGKVQGIMRVNPRLVMDEDGEQEINSDVLSDDKVTSLVASLGPLAVATNLHYTQLIHWSPFDPPPQLDECGLPFHLNGLPFDKENQ